MNFPSEMDIPARVHYAVFSFCAPSPGTSRWKMVKKQKLLPEKISCDERWNIRPFDGPRFSDNIPAAELKIYRRRK